MADWTQHARDALSQGPAALATVLATEGSAPRGAGARMVVTASGLAGTIGGGALEHRAVAQGRAILALEPGSWRVQDYPLGPLLGQCCGGRVRLLVERLHTVPEDDGPFVVTLNEKVDRAPGRDGEPLTARGPLPSVGTQFLEPRETDALPVHMFGAGHVGRAIAVRARGLPLHFAWYDLRPEAAETAGVVLADEESMVACAAGVPEGGAVVILTHDHALDYRLTAAALGSPAAYVGLIGSQTKRARFLSRLAADGIDSTRLTCPIGLPGIHGREPETIAIATLAQLLMLGEQAVKAFRGEILSVPDDPAVTGAEAIRHFEDGLLVVEDGLVLACGHHAELADRFADVPTGRLNGLIVPGLVDAHVHYPQIERIASHGEQLMQWLERHIFPAEQAFADHGHADAIAAWFLDELLRHGTTSALVFATVHAGSVDALFEAALTRDMRIVSGKVLMDLGPEGLRDTVSSGRADTEALIARWRGRGRLGYAVTPRFALTSSEAQLADAGSLIAAHPEVLMHTHLSENRGEIAAVAERFAEAADYLDVYDRFGLVGPRSVFAHCVHMSDRALSRMAGAGAGIAFCPTSNLFLGSGLFDLAQADRHAVKLGIGTDIGAGTTLSMLSTLGEAYKICQLRGASLDPFRALHLATAGGARVMGIADRVGGLLPGQEADFIVLDEAATPLLARRCAGASLHDRVFALQVLGDDRAIAATFLRGRRAIALPAPRAPT